MSVRNLMSNFNTEIALFLYNVAYVLFFVASVPFLSYKVCLEEHRASYRDEPIFVSESFCHRLISSSITDNETIGFLNHVQAKTSGASLIFNALGSAPAVFLSYFVGAWCDRFGRKPVLVVALSAFAISTILAMVIAGTPESPFFAAYFISAIQGGFAVNLTVNSSCLSMISDKVPDPDRVTVRIGYALGLSALAGLLATLSSGFVLSYDSGYFLALMSSAVISTATLCFAVVFVHETLHLVRRRRITSVHVESDGREAAAVETGYDPGEKLCGLTPIKLSLRTLFRKRPGRRRTYLLLIWFCFIVLYMDDSALESIQQLFIKHPPLSFTDSQVSFIGAYGTVFHLCGYSMVPLLAKLLRLSDLTLILVGLLCSSIAKMTIAFSARPWQLYIAYAIGGLAAVSQTGFRSFELKQIDRDESGRMFSVLLSTEFISSLTSPFLFNSIYANTLQWFPGFVFTITSSVIFCDFLLVCFIYVDKNIIHRADKSDMDTESDPFIKPVATYG